MEAIVELLVALFVQPILWLIQFANFLLQLVFEFALAAGSKGTKAAKSSIADESNNRRATQETESPRQALTGSSSYARWSVLIGFLVVIGFILFQVVNYRIQVQRKEITRLQIANVADGIVTQELHQVKQEKNPRVLADRDAWGTPLELFIDNFMLVNLVVVRSNGVDRIPGTIDDQLAIRWKGVVNPKIWKNAIDVQGEQFQTWLRNLLRVKDKLNLSIQIDMK